MICLGALAKVNPPLRSEADRLAVIEGLLDASLDIIATDHAPHDAPSKALPIEKASFGLIGSEFAFPIGYETLVQSGLLKLDELAQLMSTKPAELFGLDDEGKIQSGRLANFCAVDMDKNWTVEEADIVSKGKNTPLIGRRMCARVVWTMVKGECVYEETR